MTESEILSSYYLAEEGKPFLDLCYTKPNYFIPRFLKEETHKKKAMYALATLSKKKVCADVIFQMLSKDDSVLDKFLYSEDSKTRKNTYILLSNIVYRKAAEKLIACLESEKTYYCLPSLILALGSLEVSTHILNEFKEKFLLVKDSALAERQKEDILLALDKAIDKNSRSQVFFEGYVLKQNILLTTLPCAKPYLKKELEKLNINIVKEVNEGYVISYSNDFSSIRVYYEAFLYFDELYSVKKENLYSSIAKYLEPELFKRMFEINKVLNYRVTIFSRDNIGGKKAIINKLVKEISDKTNVFNNSASDYAFEIVIKEYQNNYRVLFKITADKDSRFQYRKNNLPASINPVTASIIAHFGGEYFNSASCVCDPFCGTGTMLIELNKVVNVKKLIGVDIFVKAITYAKENALKSKTPIEFIASDILQCDELSNIDGIISNLPFGNRVGNHKENERLYFAFFEKLGQMLKNSATLLLYTTEIELIKKCVDKNKQLSLIKQVKIESGDMFPSLFIIKFKRK